MIGIRREDKNEWERRVPLSPDQVRSLQASGGVEFNVQPSTIRAYPDGEYASAGAQVEEDLSGCPLVIGIKEIPKEQLHPGQIYLFFSHTTKGQAYNMPLLQRLIDLGCTLLDYEQITTDAGQRLIFFGRHAGYAGMIDGLWAYGKRLQAEGIESPFSAIQPAHTYGSLEQAREQITAVGRAIGSGGLPGQIRPLVCGFTGTGNVSLGAQEILDLLPTIELSPAELRAGLPDSAADTNAIFKFIIDLDERYAREGGGPVEIGELSSHPERFRNATLEWLPHLGMLVSGMFWVSALPPLLPLDDMRRMWSTGELSRLKVIADIACDIDGAIEATVKATTPDNPVFVYDVTRDAAVDGFEGDGPVILAVDNLPAELPRESSSDFGDTLLPFLPALGNCDWERSLDELNLPPELARAIIVHRGKLTPRFAYLEEHLR
jgi:alpha-aminoadipic semialdehyde synthase